MVSPFTYMASQNQITIPKLPWMNSVEMILGTVDNLDEAISACIKAKVYALDLETTGLDKRVPKGTKRTNDVIVGICLAADINKGYYFPVRHDNYAHNIPWILMHKKLSELVNSDAVAVFHNGKFDQEFLQFNGYEPLGLWDAHKSFEDTLIMAYLANPLEKKKSLKFLSQRDLDREMITLKELFGPNHTGNLNFKLLNPSWDPVVWYGCSDAVCTLALYYKYKDSIYKVAKDNRSLETIYKIEKACLPATRWTERSQLYIHRSTVENLIEKGLTTYRDSIITLYSEASKLLGRDAMPGKFKAFLKNFNTSVPLNEQLDFAQIIANRDYPDPITTIIKTIPIGPSDIANFVALPPEKAHETLANLIQKVKTRGILHAKTEALLIGYWLENWNPRDRSGKQQAIAAASLVNVSPQTEGDYTVEFPFTYDLKSPLRIGLLLKELGSDSIRRTLSGSFDTSKGSVERLLDSGTSSTILNCLKKFRENETALIRYLYPFLLDPDPITGKITIHYNAWKIDTGRFCTPGDANSPGGTSTNLHSVPNSYDPEKPECMRKLREAVQTDDPEESVIIAADYDAVELRISANLSGESKWIEAYYSCSDCSTKFPKFRKNGEQAPPRYFCPVCNSDKIGDLHTLTALNIYGADAKKRPDWKQLRQKGKGTNFALLYGGGKMSLVRTNNIDIQEADRIVRAYASNYTDVVRWWASQKETAHKFTFVRTFLGRYILCNDVTSHIPGFVAKAERNAINGPIQGTSADLTKLAMAVIYQEVKKRDWFDSFEMNITMHDELVFTVKKKILSEALEVIEFGMAQNKILKSFKWVVPLTIGIDIGLSWAGGLNVKKIVQGNEEIPEHLVEYLSAYIEKKRAELRELDIECGFIKEDVEKNPVSAKPVEIRYSLTEATVESATRIASLLRAIQGTGITPVHLYGPEGKELDWPKGSVTVDEKLFWSRIKGD